MTAAVLVILPDYRDAFSTGVRVGWNDDIQRQVFDVTPLTDVLSAHLGATVTGGLSGDPTRAHELTLTVVGARIDDVDDVAELYLGSAGITYELRAA